MKQVSVFTPSHNSQFLDDCYESLKAQTHDAWEWLVLLNNDADWQEPDDSRVRVVRVPERMGVGRAKRLAVAACHQDILVELDHDDILEPDALRQVAQAFEDHPEVVFVYSDFMQIHEDGSPDSARFNSDHGWEYDGVVCRSFEPTPAAVSYIWYGPNHLRAFRREAYDAVGGYDENLDVLDDQDLFCRLYQHGAFRHLPVSLYRQRVHGDNTQARGEFNARIQTETVELYDRHVMANSLAWAKRQGLLALDLGGAHNSPSGFLSVDLHDADLIGDVLEVLSNASDCSVGVIRASDFLEHVRPDSVVPLMNEMYRVLAHGGMLLTQTPSTDGRGAFQDPTHVSFWNENSWWYYTDANLSKYVPEIECRFQVSRMITHYPSAWHEEHKICYVTANLVAVKDGPRLPGLLRI